ncbi:uncharacterized protein DUF853 [Streptomyces sp. BK340]|nr:uncharacterized protein DUF853 [Streptomyces sp. BK340]
MDRESAYEKLSAERPRAPRAEAAEGAGKAERAGKAAQAPEEEPSLVEQVVGSSMVKSLARSVGTRIGREITRSLFGTARRRR